MDNTLYVALSNQLAMRRTLDLIANNLANMNTTGFKKEAMMYRDFGVEMQNVADQVTKKIDYVQDVGVVRDLSNGGFVSTSNPLDVAINGHGYFAVNDPAGGVKYTRNGNFRRSPTNQLVDASGRVVQGEGGAAITFQEQDTDIKFAPDGTVSSNSGKVGKVALFEFDNERALKKIGDSLYDTGGANPSPAKKSSLIQGGLEGSNVTSVLELTNMIDVQRRYQAVAQLISQTEELQRSSIQRLAKVA